MQLANKNVLVTGGSRGLGLALGGALGAAGARIVLCARGRDEVERAAQKLRETGIDAHAIVADIADKHAIYPLAAKAAALIGPIDILVHNASTLGPVPLSLLLDTDCEDLERALAVNLVGPFRLSKALAGSMLVRGHGVLVHISSDAASEAYPTWGAYGVSKAALDQLARSFAVELAGTGIQVISIDPGEMDTRMHRDAVPGADPASLSQPEVVAATILRMLQRVEQIPQGARLRVQEWQD